MFYLTRKSNTQNHIIKWQNKNCQIIAVPHSVSLEKFYIYIYMNDSCHDLRFNFLKRATTLGQQLHGAQWCLLGAWRSWRMSVPSEGVTVLQESPATLSLSPVTSSNPSGPLTATVHWSNDARAWLGCGSEVWGLSTAPCREVWEMCAAEGEGGRVVTGPGGRRGFWQWQHRRHAKRDLGHAEESTQTSTIHRNNNDNTMHCMTCVIVIGQILNDSR